MERNGNRDSKERDGLVEQTMDNQGLVYQIQVRGMLDKEWSDWFAGLTIETVRGKEGESVTVLTGTIVDQSALRGLLCRLWDLNLTVISVVQIDERKTRE